MHRRPEKKIKKGLTELQRTKIGVKIAI